MLAGLAAEKGQNWFSEVFNGMSIQLPLSWTQMDGEWAPEGNNSNGEYSQFSRSKQLPPKPQSGPPTLGWCSFEFVTKAKTADLSLRCNLARRLLMPGPNRWRSIPVNLRDDTIRPRQVNVADVMVEALPCRDLADIAEFDDTRDMSHLCMDADGVMKSVDRVFHDCDRDQSGFLDKQEFCKTIQRLRVKAAHAEKLWADADRRGDGRVDINGWTQIWSKVRQAMVSTTEDYIHMH